jgi:hypothetical protein
VIFNAPGAHTVNLDTAISFGSFCNTKVHGKEFPKDGEVPTSCRRLFRTPPASPARSVFLPVHAGTTSEPSERATDASNMSAIACDKVIAAAPKDADKLAVIQPSVTAICSPTAANSGLGSRANAETADRSGVLGATAGEKHSTVFAGEHPLPRSATQCKLMPQEVAHTCAQNIGFMHGMSSNVSIIPNGSDSIVCNSLHLPAAVNTGDFPRSPTREELIAFGGISEPAFNGIRSSERIRAQPNADVSQMERAIQLAQQRDNQGKASVPKHSFTSLSNDEILARANKLGVSFGKTSIK